MKIRFTIVRPDILAQVSAEVETLQRAVDVGDLDSVDAATKKLVALTVDCSSVDLTEEEWREFLDGIRIRNPEFQSNYLLPGEICADILPKVAPSDVVLELPIDEEPEEEAANV